MFSLFVVILLEEKESHLLRLTVLHVIDFLKDQ